MDVLARGNRDERLIAAEMLTELAKTLRQKAEFWDHLLIVTAILELVCCAGYFVGNYNHEAFILQMSFFAEWLVCFVLQFHYLLKERGIWREAMSSVCSVGARRSREMNRPACDFSTGRTMDGRMYSLEQDNSRETAER